MPSDTGKTGAEYPFAHMMGQAKNAADEFTRMFANLKLPAVPDAEALFNAHKRNLDAITAANRVALEGAQAVARRHVEIMQQTMAELSESLSSLAGAETAQAKAAKHAELLRHAYEHAVANSKELSDLIQRSNAEAVELLNRRFTEALDEVRTLMEKANSPGA